MLPEIAKIPLVGIAQTQNPFPYFSISQVLSADKAEQLLLWFKASELWSFTKTSFYTQYEFSLMGVTLPASLDFLNSGTTLQYLTENFERYFGKKLSVTDITAHKLIDGHKMGVHNDFVGSAETHRLIIQLNDNWSEANGGYLMLFNSKEPSDVAKIIRPLHNTGIGFEISDHSYHAVSAVHDFTRYTLVYTFNVA